MHPFLLNLYILGFSSGFTGNVVCYWFHCDCIFLGVCEKNVFWAYIFCWCVCYIIFEYLRCILECCHMIYYGPGIIPVCDFSCPSDATFTVFPPLEWHGAVVLMYPNFIFPNIISGTFSIFGVTIKSWLLIGWKKISFFAWFTSSSSSGYASTIGTLRCSALANRFDCGDLFIWVPSWFTSWSFFWPTSLTGTLGGTAGGFAFLNISARVFNASLCPFNNFT